MKKLYASLALVAAAALSMSAQSLVTSKPFTEGQLRTVKARPVSSINFDTPHLTTTVANGAQTRVASRVEGLNDSYIGYQTDHFGKVLTNAFVNVKAEADGSYSFPGLIGWEDGKWVEAIKYNSDIKATVNANGDIELPLGQLLAKYELSATEVYDIVLWTVTADGKCANEGTYTLTKVGSTYANAEIGLGVGFQTAEGVSLILAVADLKFVEPNFDLSYNWLSPQGTDTDFNLGAYVEVVDEVIEGVTYKTLSSSAFFYQAGDPVPMSMDIEGDYAYTQNPMAFNYYEEEGGPYYYYPMFIDPEDGKEYYSTTLEIRAALEYDGNGELQKVSMPLDFGNLKFTRLLIQQDNGNQSYYYGFLKNIVLTNKNAGVETVLGDNADENAPVEYYNLQGMKLNNPAAGQLVIRRQGSKVSKLIVR